MSASWTVIAIIAAPYLISETRSQHRGVPARHAPISPAALSRRTSCAADLTNTDGLGARLRHLEVG